MIKWLDKYESATKLAIKFDAEKELSVTGKRTMWKLHSFLQNIANIVKIDIQKKFNVSIFGKPNEAPYLWFAWEKEKGTPISE